MLKNKSGGFTLIEVVMVLAITAGMVAIIFAGQAQVRARAEFTDTFNSAVSALNVVRNSAATSDAKGGGTNPTKVVFAQLITARGGDAYLTVTPIYGAANQALSCEQQKSSEVLSKGTPTQITLDYGVQVGGVSGYTREIAYHRLLCGGQLMTYNLASGNPLLLANYPENLANGQNVNIPLISPGNAYTAQIQIQGQNNGAIAGVIN